MNGLDLAVLVVIVLSAAFAFARGFVREALSIIAWGGAIAITLSGFNKALDIAERTIKTKLLAQFVTGAGLFLVSLVILSIITGLIARQVRMTALSPIDRTLGLLFGLVRGAVLVSLAYLALGISLPPSDWPNWIKDAKSGPFLAEGAELLRDLLPPALRFNSAVASSKAQQLIAPYLNPTAPAPAGQPHTPAYGRKEERDLNRVIQNAH
jgi:membrane protein required for colicin V production